MQHAHERRWGHGGLLGFAVASQISKITILLLVIVVLCFSLLARSLSGAIITCLGNSKTHVEPSLFISTSISQSEQYTFTGSCCISLLAIIDELNL